MHKYIEEELKLTTAGGVVKRGDTGMDVRRVQEWLFLHGFAVGIDGVYGPATEAAVKKFQQSKGYVEKNGRVDVSVFYDLTRPLRDANDAVEMNRKTVLFGLGSFSSQIAHMATWHLQFHPREAPSDNKGPWVRMYCNRMETLWCAGFVSFLIREVSTLGNLKMPLSYTLSCDALVADAKARKLFVPEGGLRTAPPAGSIFVLRNTKNKNDWIHTGIVIGGDAQHLECVEGNTNSGGSREGFEVCRRFRSYKNIDFIVFK